MGVAAPVNSPELAGFRPRRVRIVYLSASGQLGGAERCLLDVLQSLRRTVPEWSLTLVSARPGPLVERAEALGVAVEVLAMPQRVAGLGDSAGEESRRHAVGVVIRGARSATALVSYGRQLGEVLQRLRPDIVHTNGYKMHMLGAWNRPRAAALVWHLHDYASSRSLMSIAVRAFSRRCDAGVAVSQSVAEDVSPYWHGRTSIAVVLNGIDLQTFSPDGARADLDALAGLTPAPAGVVRVGLVATMARFKGHDVFLRALARLPRSVPVRGYIVSGSLYETRGSEQSMDALRDLAQALGVADRVGFTGFVNAPADAMRALDVVVHASTGPEPFGLVIAEGMACGRAVITSGAGGAGEIVEPDVDALVHAPGNDQQLAEAIERLAADPELRMRIAMTARRHAVARFDRDRLGPALVPIYRAAVERRGGSRI